MPPFPLVTMAGLTRSFDVFTVNRLRTAYIELSIDRMIRALNSERSLLHWSAFGIVIAVAAALRLFAFQGFAGSDPHAYSELAAELAQGRLHIPDYDGPILFAIRIGIYAPTAALIRSFGLSETALAAYPFMASMGGCLIAYALGRRLGTPLTGLISLAVLAVLPLDIHLASLLWSDAIAAFWGNAGVGLVIVALRRPRWSSATALGMLAGLCFGMSWLCRESIVYLVPFVALLTLLYKSSGISVRAAAVGGIALGSVAVLGAETALYWRLTGDLLFRFHATERNYVESAVWFFNPSSPYFGWTAGGYGRALVKRLFIDGPVAFIYAPAMSFVPALALLGVAWATTSHKRFGLLTTAWLGSLMFMFNFMTSSLTSYKPLPLSDRYLFPVILPSAILFGGFLASLLSSEDERPLRIERRFWATAIIVVFVAMSAIGVRRIAAHRPEEVERAVAGRMSHSDVVYTDLATAKNLVFLRTGRFSLAGATTVPWEELDLATVPAGSYVLVNRNRLDFLATSYDYPVPPLTARPPVTWRKEWFGNGAELYRVEAN
jgi:4-amino-4-deoxy-L-arabinose transferase-like glycosyltransferase